MKYVSGRQAVEIYRARNVIREQRPPLGMPLGGAGRRGLELATGSWNRAAGIGAGQENRGIGSAATVLNWLKRRRRLRRQQQQQRQQQHSEQHQISYTEKKGRANTLTISKKYFLIYFNSKTP